MEWFPVFRKTVNISVNTTDMDNIIDRVRSASVPTRLSGTIIHIPVNALICAGSLLLLLCVGVWLVVSNKSLTLL